MTRNATAIVTPGAALLGVAVLTLTLRQAVRPSQARVPTRAPTMDPGAAVRAAKRMNRAAGMIATSVLADSAIEHYRGSFHNKAMVIPLVTAALSLAVSAHGSADRRRSAEFPQIEIPWQSEARARRPAIRRER